MSRLGKRQLHELYYYMKLTRRLEEEIARLHREQKIEGPIVVGVGQEAVSIGAAYSLNSADAVASSLPSFGHLLVRGFHPAEIFAHVLGKDNGPMRGRDGTTYLGDGYRGVISPTGHVATHVGVLAGVALAHKYLGKSLVAVALADEAATATGDFHEGLNFAAVHRLPLIVVLDHQSASKSKGRPLYESSSGYGVPSLPVDGVDILQVLQVVETAVERARDGKGPTLVEVRTARGPIYGLCDEAVPLPFIHRRRKAAMGESDRVEEPYHDPVVNFESFLVDHDLLQPVERGLILNRIEHLVADGVRSAEEESFPDVDTLARGVYDSASSGPQTTSSSDAV